VHSQSRSPCVPWVVLLVVMGSAGSGVSTSAWAGDAEASCADRIRAARDMALVRLLEQRTTDGVWDDQADLSALGAASYIIMLRATGLIEQAGCIVGTDYVLRALGRNGLRYDLAPVGDDRLLVQTHGRMKSAIDFLTQHQNDDGGIGIIPHVDRDRGPCAPHRRLGVVNERLMTGDAGVSRSLVI
jgi:hypothetical protein